MAKKASKKSTKKVAASKAPAKKTTAKKAAAKKKPAKKAAAATAARSTAKKPAARETTAKSTAAKTAAGTPKTASSSLTITPRRSEVAGGKSARVETRIVAALDVGFGNRLFVRGEGAGLSWDRGAVMKNAGESRWTFATSNATADLVVKFLINDVEWSLGQNVVARLGEETVVTPKF